ncbi:MAG: hypothetical protein ACKVQS_10235 [Fimbriimonadaceae bacterium]
MLSLILAAKLFSSDLAAQDQQQQLNRLSINATFVSQVNPISNFDIIHYLTPMDAPKESPLKEWKFSYLSMALCQPLEQPSPTARIRVFSNTRDRQDADDISQWVARYMGRLWNYLYFRCDIDHNARWGRLVDIYLTNEGDPARDGQAGSAQINQYDSQDLDSADRPTPRANIYVFKISEAKRGIQLSRELAHEYGHALLPYATGFEKPESYPNGDLGERIFLSFIRDDLKAGKLTSEDIIFTSQTDLDSYYRAKVQPHVTRIAASGPDFKLFTETNEKAYFEWVGIGTYLSRICPPMLFARYVNLCTKVAADSELAITSAAEERETWQLTIPDELKGKPLYIPLVKGKVTNAKILQKSGNWAKIQPEPGKIVTIKNPPLPPSNQNLK